MARFAEKIQPSTRTMDTEVDVPNPTLTLVPGMYAEVNLHIEESRDALAVPLDAVDRSSASARAYTVDPSGVIHIVPVTLGLETDQSVEIRSGLQEGDIVVVGPPRGLDEDSRCTNPRCRCNNMSRFAIRTPYLIVVVCLVITSSGSSAWCACRWICSRR